MELADLLDREGLSAEDMADTVAWARDRAEELVAGLVADAELGPLLDGDFEGTPLPPVNLEPSLPRDADAPEALPRSQTEPTPVAESPAARSEPDDAPLAASTAAALADLPPPPERPDLPEVGPGVESEPMADAAYDQGSVATEMPTDVGGPHLADAHVGHDAGADDGWAQGEPGVAADARDAAADDHPDLVAASLGAGIEPAGDEVTQPRTVGTELGQAEPGVTNSGSIEIDEEEIELLDDDDLELVDDEDDQDDAPEQPPLDPIGEASDGDGDDEVPEWKAALTSASLGGGAQADEDSGLYRVGAGRAQKVTAEAPAEPAAAEPEPAAPAEAPVDHDESMDIDLGDL